MELGLQKEHLLELCHILVGKVCICVGGVEKFHVLAILNMRSVCPACAM